MGRVSRVNEGVQTSTVCTGGDSVAVMRAAGLLGNLGLSSGDLGSLNWSSLRLNSGSLNSGSLNSLRLNSLRLRGRAARELSSVSVVLEVKMSWVGRINKRVEISSLLSRLSLLHRGKLSLDRSGLSDRGRLSDRSCLSDGSWLSDWLPYRSRLCPRSLTSRSRLNKLSGCSVRIKCSRV